MSVVVDDQTLPAEQLGLTTLGQLLKRTGFIVFDGYWVQPHPALLKTWKRLLRPYFSHTFMLLARPG